MIKIGVKNFLSFEDINVDLDNINILIGENDSGKSNIYEALQYIFYKRYKYDIDSQKFFFAGSKDKTTVEYYLDDDEKAYMKQLIEQLEGEIKADADLIKWFREDGDYYIEDSNNVKTYIDNMDLYKSILPIVIKIDIATNDFEYNKLIKDLTNSGRIKREIENKVNNYIERFWGSHGKSAIYIEESIQANDEYKVRVPINNRGSGFKSFVFYILTILRIIYENDDSNNGQRTKRIIFIEEPERTLHPRAQKSLYKFFEEIVQNNKNFFFIISTHSSYYINHKSNVILLKKYSGRSEIIKRPIKHNWNELRQILGIEPSDSFIIGDVTILVEGLCEKKFIPRLLDKFIDIDLERINFIDCRGVSNMANTLKYIYDISDHNIIALVDSDSQGNDAKDAINKIISGDSKLPDGKVAMKDSIKVISLIDKENINKQIAFEDIFQKDMFVEAFNYVYVDYSINIEEFDEFANENDLATATWAKIAERYIKSKEKVKEVNLRKIEINEYLIEKCKELPQLLKPFVETIKEIIDKN